MWNFRKTKISLFGVRHLCLRLIIYNLQVVSYWRSITLSNLSWRDFISVTFVISVGSDSFKCNNHQIHVFLFVQLFDNNWECGLLQYLKLCARFKQRCWFYICPVCSYHNLSWYDNRTIAVILEQFFKPRRSSDVVEMYFSWIEIESLPMYILNMR